MSDRVVLAVDGGNSKTDLALVREDGALLAHPLIGQDALSGALLDTLFLETREAVGGPAR